MVRWTLKDTLAFLLLLSLLLPSLLIMFIPSTFKRPVSSWKALNLRKTLLMASSVRLKPLNCSRLPCVYAQETLTFLDRKSGSAGMPRPISYAVFCLKKKNFLRVFLIQHNYHRFLTPDFHHVPPFLSYCSVVLI